MSNLTKLRSFKRKLAVNLEADSPLLPITSPHPQKRRASFFPGKISTIKTTRLSTWRARGQKARGRNERAKVDSSSSETDA